MRQFRYVKARGMDIAWEKRLAIRERMTESEFCSLYEGRLYNARWRHELLAMVNNASWTGVTDHFMKPHLFRWEFQCRTPETWNADDRFCAYIAFSACLPEHHSYELRIDEYTIEIKNGAAYTEHVPRVYTEAPSVTLEFWNFFQRHLKVLMDAPVLFNPPVFQYGLAVDVDLNFPVDFRLMEGGVLQVREENKRVVVRVMDAQGIFSREQEYETSNAFWWVWRNAIAPVRPIE